jgi:hypothetical protein
MEATIEAVIFLREYYFRFYGSPGHEEGLISPVTALDEEQAAVFAVMIATKLAEGWGIPAVQFERYHVHECRIGD